jgi:WD40 repeat protein
MRRRTVTAKHDRSVLPAVALICLSVCVCPSCGASKDKPVATLRGHKDMIMGLAFSPDGKLLASGSHDGSVCLWDIKKRQVRKELHGHEPGHFILAVAFSRDGKLLASGSSDKTVKLWDVDTGKEQATLPGHADSVESVAFSPTSDVLASAAAGNVLIWELPIGKQIAKLDTDTRQATKVAFSPDGKTLASAGLSDTVELWDLTTFEKKASLETRGFKFAVAYSPDGATIIALSSHAAVDLWDARTHKVRDRHLADLSLRNALSLAVFPDSKTIAVSLTEGVPCVDSATGKKVAFFPVREGAEGVVTSIAVSPNGKTLAVADDMEVKLFDATIGD